MLQKRPDGHLLFCILMAGTMTGCVSATVTAVNLGLQSGYITEWLRSWAIAFPVGFFLLLLLSPFLRAVTEHIAGTSEIF